MYHELDTCLSVNVKNCFNQTNPHTLHWNTKVDENLDLARYTRRDHYVKCPMHRMGQEKILGIVKNTEHCQMQTPTLSKLQSQSSSFSWRHASTRWALSSQLHIIRWHLTLTFEDLILISKLEQVLKTCWYKNGDRKYKIDLGNEELSRCFCKWPKLENSFMRPSFVFCSSLIWKMTSVQKFYQ